MTRVRAAVVLALASSAALVATGQEPQFRAGTHTVSVYATVVDRQGRLVPNLGRDDFEVLDNGRPQALTVFSADRQPITIVVMLDRSGSVAEHFDLVQQAATEFVKQLGPGDKARVGSFSHTIRIDPETFTSDRDQLLHILSDRLQYAGSTPLWNATDAAITALSAQEGRRVVLVFTDGRDAPEDDVPHVSFAEVQARVQAEEVMVYAIGLADRCAPAPTPPPAGDAGAPRFEDQRSGGQGVARRPLQLPPPRRPGRGIPRLPIPVPVPIPGRGLPPRTPPIFEPRRGVESGCTPKSPDPGLPVLAEAGGGGYFELQESDDLASTFARVADELHQQYLLAYTAPVHDGQVHAIEVRIKKAGLTARARRGYMAPAK